MVVVSVSFEPCWDRQPAGIAFPIGTAASQAWPATRLDHWRRVAPTLVTDDARLSVAIGASIADLASLRIFDRHHAERVVVAAGAPWFMTLFGRDSLITSWMVLPFLPELAIGTIDTLAELQGTGVHPKTEEEPGRILHELRRHGGDAAFANRGRYFGTVDATPLFVMVVGEAARWGHLPRDELAARWPSVGRGRMDSARDRGRQRLPALPAQHQRGPRQPGLEGLVGRRQLCRWAPARWTDRLG
jgi:glycogen debranching enzyme